MALRISREDRELINHYKLHFSEALYPDVVDLCNFKFCLYGRIEAEI